jgi:hypothetical protein
MTENVSSVLVLRGPVSPPDGTSWSWSTSSAITSHHPTLNPRTKISLPRPPRCIIVTHKVYTYAGLFIRRILIGRGNIHSHWKRVSSILKILSKSYRNTTRLLQKHFSTFYATYYNFLNGRHTFMIFRTHTCHLHSYLQKESHSNPWT